MSTLPAFVWDAGKPVDAPAFAALFEGPLHALAQVTGHFALHLRNGTRHVLARDPLGVHKLFFAVTSDGDVRSSSYAHDLIGAGVPFEAVYSVPQGHRVIADPAQRTYHLQQYSELRFGDPDAPMHDIEAHAREIRAALDRVFAGMRARFAERPVWITLSGGLDSSTIAALAREHLRNLRGITFTTKDAAQSQQSDLHFARLMADHAGIPLDVVEVDRARILASVDAALVDGQDFRDFNVHCALVNLVLAEHLAEQAGSGPAPVVLTGDAMNELVADYTPVAYGDTVFYALPRMSKGRLRRFLVAGLDSGDREVGTFGRHGLEVVQPYTLCADVYARLPGGFLEDASAKQRLVRAVVGEGIPEPIYRRPKVRAQVGSSDTVGGTLAALVDGGLDQGALLGRFARLFQTTERAARGFLRGGFYRFSTALPAAVTLGGSIT